MPSHRARLVLLAALLNTLVAPLGAQVLPPVPEKTAPAPAYEPPAPTPPPTPTPPPAEVKPVDPLPSLVQRDDAGQFIALQIPAALAAVRLLPLDAEAKEKVEAEIGRRQADIDVLVIDNIANLIEVRQALLIADENLGIDKMSELAGKVRVFNADPLLERLQKAGLLTLAQRNVCENAVKEYKKVRREDAATKYGHGNKLLLEGFRFSMDEMTGEAFGSLDRQLAAAAPRFEALLQGAALPADQLNHAVGLLKNTTDEAEREEATRSIFFKDLSNEQRQSVLRAARG